jgi:hypothetical protein
MSENAMLYTAVYSDVDAALADLDALEHLHHEEMLGKYDAAVIDKEDGKPHIVKRVDRPGIRIIPELLGRGTLPRGELHDAAAQLDEKEAGLVVVGEPTLEKGFDRAVTRAASTVKRSFDATTDELADALTQRGTD